MSPPLYSIGQNVLRSDHEKVAQSLWKRARRMEILLSPSLENTVCHNFFRVFACKYTIWAILVLVPTNYFFSLVTGYIFLFLFVFNGFELNARHLEQYTVETLYSIIFLCRLLRYVLAGSEIIGWSFWICVCLILVYIWVDVSRAPRSLGSPL